MMGDFSTLPLGAAPPLKVGLAAQKWMPDRFD
jgi:hypothetical protein